jgi:two-component system, LytTR family, response regulator
MNKIRSIIIDDEAANRSLLYNLLLKHCPSVEVIGTGASAEEGYALITEQQPDLVFLDIRMPEQSGFELLRLFKEISFHLIFVTAFDEYAIKAFEFNAVDYILKPIDQTKLIISVNRVNNLIRLNENQSGIVHFIRSLDEETQLLKSISLHSKDKVVLVDIDQISYVIACRNYCELVTADNQRILSSKPLSDYEKLLHPYKHFLRISNGHLINTNYIRSYSKGTACSITMTNQQEIEVSRRKKHAVLLALKNRIDIP